MNCLKTPNFGFFQKIFLLFSTWVITPAQEKQELQVEPEVFHQEKNLK